MQYVQNKYRFNGKELQNHEFSDETGLDWYDYGARMYDDQIGRWTAIDKLSEKYFNLSPYAYAANNPILNVDVEGKEVIVTHERYYAAEAGNLQINFYPRTVHDLGVTGIYDAPGDRSPTYSKNSKGTYDVKVHVVELINPNLQQGWPLDRKNPGLVEEVTAHEDGHLQQFEDAFKSDLTVASGFSKVSDGKKNAINFSGKIDDILNQADRQYDKAKSINPDLVKGISKEDYVKGIFVEALGAVSQKMPKDVENDANK